MNRLSARNQILRSFELALQEPSAEKRRAHLTFVVVGGGPTGVESAGALSEFVRLVLAKDFGALEIKDVRVILLEATHALLGPLVEKLREETAQRLWHKHVEVRFGAQVVEFDGERVALKGGEVIPARTLIWSAGVRAAGLVERLGLPVGAQGRVRIGPTLQVPGLDDVFVIGDASLLEHEGRPLPMMAPLAMQQGRLAAQNIARGRAARDVHLPEPPGRLRRSGAMRRSRSSGASSSRASSPGCSGWRCTSRS